MSVEHHKNYAVMDGPIKDDWSSLIPSKRTCLANKALPSRTKKTKKGPNDFDSGDSAYYSEYSSDSDMAIPGNTVFNQMQYAKKQKKAKAKAAEQKKNANRKLRWQDRVSRRQTS